MSTFKQTIDRIVADLRRSNLTVEAGRAINDAITEAAKNRFYFNEMHTSFVTVPGTEYYTDLGVTEVDSAWFMSGSSRYNLDVESELTADDLASGNVTGGQLLSLSRYGGQFRLYPIPNAVIIVFLDGYGKLTPNPLVADADTNAWLTDGELYILALAKRNLLRDVVRDYGESRILEAIAEDYAAQLTTVTTLKSTTSTIRGPGW